MAAAALLLGVLVYLTDRSASPPVLLPRVQPLAGLQLFGALAQWLPSFVHPFAFGLVTAALLPPRPWPRHAACTAWGAVDLAFEAGQHPAIAQTLAAALYEALGRSLPVQWIADYFLRGTFDIGDLLAIGLGALCAAGMLTLLQPRAGLPHGRSPR